jgi:succinate dehydrogenase/fumarate reductase flavoprotein subunit
MGGNSTKATSGINGAGTQTQQDAGIPDSAKIFFEDTKKSVCSRSTNIARLPSNHTLE